MVAVAILGAGGHGNDIAEIVRAWGDEPTFYDDAPDGRHWQIGAYFEPCLDHEGEPYFVGVNDPSTRRRIVTEWATWDSEALVHPKAWVTPGTDLSPGVVVGAGTTVGPQVTLGPHVHVGAGCTITRTTIEAFTTVSPGVDIAGDVTIGEECLIGVGATVSNLVTIGDRVTIGAGAVVPPRATIPDGETWISRERKAEHSERVSQIAALQRREQP